MRFKTITETFYGNKFVKDGCEIESNERLDKKYPAVFAFVGKPTAANVQMKPAQGETSKSGENANN